jgi:hypothetical protein
MRKQFFYICLISLLLIVFTSAAFAYFKSSVSNSGVEVVSQQEASKTTETLWEALTRQIIGSVNL